MADERPIVSTAHGRVRGRTDEGVHEFLGIRYGADTGGEGRFRPPREPEPWDDIAEATSWGARAPQTVVADGYVNPADPDEEAPGYALWLEEELKAGLIDEESEDCLFLNVWTGSLDGAARKPVMVWIHGGGFNAGSGQEPNYGGADLVRGEDVVVVTLNHRIAALGYINLGALDDPDFADCMNLGTLDLVLALRWVRENIAAFGGDPDCVTILGNSGGSWKTASLLSAAPAKGLFHRAIGQSAHAIRYHDRERTAIVARLFAQRLGGSPDDLSVLRTAPIEEILAAQHDLDLLIGPAGVPNILATYSPVVDGEIIPAHPFEPVPSPVGADVPYLTGIARTEMTLFWPEEYLHLDDAALERELEAWAPQPLRDKIVSLYRRTYPEADAARLWAYLVADLVMLPYAYRAVENRARAGSAPTYLYRIDWETPVLDGALKSPHAIEIALIARTWRRDSGLTGVGEDVAKLSDVFSRTWATFARTGNPNADPAVLPHWPAYETGAGAVMHLDVDSHVEATSPDDEARVLMEELAAVKEAELTERLARLDREGFPSRTTRAVPAP